MRESSITSKRTIVTALTSALQYYGGSELQYASDVRGDAREKVTVTLWGDPQGIYYGGARVVIDTQEPITINAELMVEYEDDRATEFMLRILNHIIHVVTEFDMLYCFNVSEFKVIDQPEELLPESHPDDWFEPEFITNEIYRHIIGEEFSRGKEISVAYDTDDYSIVRIGVYDQEYNLHYTLSVVYDTEKDTSIICVTPNDYKESYEFVFRLHHLIKVWHWDAVVESGV